LRKKCREKRHFNLPDLIDKAPQAFVDDLRAAAFCSGPALLCIFCAKIRIIHGQAGAHPV